MPRNLPLVEIYSSGINHKSQLLTPSCGSCGIPVGRIEIYHLYEWQAVQLKTGYAASQLVIATGSFSLLTFIQYQVISARHVPERKFRTRDLAYRNSWWIGSELKWIAWSEWFDMNQVTWTNWKEWIELNERMKWNEMNEFISTTWHEWIKMNELTWMNEWIDMNELKPRNWNEWIDWDEWIETNDLNWMNDMNELTWIDWNEWSEMNEFKRMNWHEWNEISELTWMNWN